MTKEAVSYKLVILFSEPDDSATASVQTWGELVNKVNEVLKYRKDVWSIIVARTTISWEDKEFVETETRTKVFKEWDSVQKEF